jgi:hypothetical protein
LRKRRWGNIQGREILICRLWTHASARMASVIGERRWAAAISPVCLGFELGGLISSAGCTGAKHARRRTYLGRRDRLRRGGDGARHGEAAALLRRALLGDSRRGDYNKRHGRSPNLLARLWGSFTTAERRQRSSDSGEERRRRRGLGFRRARRKRRRRLGLRRGTLGGAAAT